jgi:hypothetical protein
MKQIFLTLEEEFVYCITTHGNGNGRILHDGAGDPWSSGEEGGACVPPNAARYVRLTTQCRPIILLL